MIQRHNLTILLSHPPFERSKDIVLKFIMNFKPTNKIVWIRGQYYPITPKIIVEALKFGHHRHFDEQTYQVCIMENGLEASV